MNKILEFIKEHKEKVIYVCLYVLAFICGAVIF